MGFFCTNKQIASMKVSYNESAWEGDTFRNIGIDIGYDEEINFQPKREVLW